MNFLRCALLTPENKLVAALGEEYSETNRNERIKQKIFDLNDIQLSINAGDNVGFDIKNQTLTMDNPSSVYITKEQYEELMSIKETVNNRLPSLIDLLFTLLKISDDYPTYIVHNDYTLGTLNNMHLLSVSKLRISENTMNIYGPVMTTNGWRTISLINTETVATNEFMFAIKSDYEQMLSDYKEYIVDVDKILLNDEIYKVFRTSIPMRAYGPNISGPAINYIASQYYSNLLARYVLNEYAPKEFFNSDNSTADDVVSSYREDKTKPKKKIALTNIKVENDIARFRDIDGAFNMIVHKEEPKTDTYKFACKVIFRAMAIITAAHGDHSSNEGNCLQLYLKYSSEIERASLEHGLELYALRYTHLGILNGLSVNNLICSYSGGGYSGYTIFKRIGGGTPPVVNY